MNIDQFDFHLPEELIAQTPLIDRTSSRLLVLNKQTNEINHDYFYHLKDYLKQGDCLVLNDTKVLPARLFGIKENTGAKIEILLLKENNEDIWEALVKPAKRIKQKDVIVFSDKLKAECVEELDEGIRRLEFLYEGIFLEILEELGEMPLPPYIREQLQETDRYQTVYATNDGSAAAPTAGLHFTKEMLQELQESGVHIAYITLHVGLGTFRPVSVDNVKDHDMHSEYYYMSKETAETLTKVKGNKGRIIAVGTTSTRTLESIVAKHGGFKESHGWTNIFIYPPYEFKAIDGLITNFHLPKSTLVMLVSALASQENILHAYEEAVEEKYRFFSFGDAMFITE